MKSRKQLLKPPVILFVTLLAWYGFVYGLGAMIDPETLPDAVKWIYVLLLFPFLLVDIPFYPVLRPLGMLDEGGKIPEPTWMGWILIFFLLSVMLAILLYFLDRTHSPGK